MEYKFARTAQGPVVVGEDEILFWHERQVIEYVMEDPDFFVKAKAFLAETIREYSEALITSFSEPVVGMELVMTLPQYVHASQTLARLEHESTKF